MSKGVSITLPLGSDAHFFEESIHPSTIKASLSSADPSSSSSTPVLVKGLKWLLAMMSKGRDLSDFFPAVVKLVGAQSLEARKMVYMFLVHYADHDDTCRELALLSINSFQRGLADSEQLIRALALRVMSSIRVSDILQIQILAVQKCSKDPSPYVRKCAANALSKLHSQCSSTEQTLLKDLLKDMLTEDGSTMVLTSAIIAFWELYPEEYEMLHGSYRKLCHLLTDMDEWGQVIAIECLAYYCRKSFRKPQGGSGELIDKERRIERSKNPDDFGIENGVKAGIEYLGSEKEKRNKSISNSPGGNGIPPKVKRRVVRKAFYSDEEDESSEEEVYASAFGGQPLTLAAALRERQVMENSPMNNLTQTIGDKNVGDDEDESLDPDHRLLLRSSLPLLKSRNSAVVLAVCSLHYYCGVSSIKIRTALGKALVRIHRDRREIQYVVLTSIKELVGECPSAFTPFLADFFVKAMDPSFTRMIKLEILTHLALEPKSINDILHELQTYVRHDDKEFVCSSIKAIGRIAEISRTVFQRVHKDQQLARTESDTIILNCLNGLTAMTRCSRNEKVIGECVITMTFLLGQFADLSIRDPNNVKTNAIRRLLFLVTRSLLYIAGDINEEAEEDTDGEENDWFGASEKNIICLPIGAIANALWLLGEWFTSSHLAYIFPLDVQQKKNMNREILHLLAKSFPEFEPLIKLHSLHYSSKMLLTGDTSISSICSHILAQGRLDVNPDIRDRARFESSLLSLIAPTFIGDFDATNSKPNSTLLTPNEAKASLLSPKLPSTLLPLHQAEEDIKEEKFRFGTLSSLLHHRAGKAYLALPLWAQSDSDKSLRDPPTTQEDSPEKNEQSFYDDENNEFSSDESSEDESTSDSDASYDSSSEETDDDTGDEDSSVDSSSDDDSDEDESSEDRDIDVMQHSNGKERNLNFPAPLTKSIVDESSEEDTSSNDDTEDSSDSSEDEQNSITQSSSLTTSNTLLPMELNGFSKSPSSLRTPSKKVMTSNNDLSEFMSGKQESLLPISPNKSGSSTTINKITDDLSGLVMAPLVVNTEDEPTADMNTDSGHWFRLIRPELAGGLSLDARYVRGSTRKRELNVAGLTIDENVLLLQLKFENKRKDFMSLRRIKLIQRTSSTLRRAILPLEISALNKNQSSSTFLILVFSPSSSPSSLSARFDVKSDKGTTAIDIRPPLSEMLGSLRLNESEFDAILGKMSAPHQKITLAFDWKSTFDSEVVAKYCNLTIVDTNTKAISKFVASLPHTNESICILIEKSSTGIITIYCDNAIASNAVMEAIKEAVAS